MVQVAFFVLKSSYPYIYSGQGIKGCALEYGSLVHPSDQHGASQVVEAGGCENSKNMSCHLWN